MANWYDIKAAGKSAEISIYDEIGGWGVSAKAFANDLKELRGVTDITLRLNSPGGSVFDGMAIYNLLKGHDAQITVYVDGLAASMASVIAMAGDLIVMPENSLMMIHNPWTMTAGDAAELRKNAELLDKIKTAMLSAYSSRTGMDEAAIAELMDAETWFTGAEAVANGFADETVEAVKMAACFDLSGFKNAPKELNKEFPKVSAVADESKTPHEVNQMGDNVNATAQTVDIEQVKADAIAAERKRVSDINAVFAAFPQHKAIAEKCTDAEDARAKLLVELGKNETPTGGVVSVSDNGRKARNEAMSDIIMLRAGKKTDRDVGQNPYRSKSLAEMAASALEANGVSTVGMDRNRIVAAAFTHSSSDFPKLLENSMGKLLQDAYSTFPETWRSIADVGQVSDFKQNTRIRLGSFNSLDTIGEGAEYTAGTIGEEYETIQASTKGKMITLTRQMIVNDDLNGFARLAQMMGRAAQRTIGNDVYNILINNPTLSDGSALFHADHSNLTASGTAISAASVGLGRSMMRKQRDVNGNDYLNIAPNKLIVPVALEDVARVLMASETDPSQSNSRKPNPVAGMAEVISDPRLDAASATAWYLLGDPSLAPTIEVAFLDGNEMPYIDSEEGFTTDGVRWKVRLDYGVAAVDYRGAYKNVGA